MGGGSVEVQKIYSCKGKFTKEIGHILTKKYSGTSPLGHLYLIDTSIQETQNLVPENAHLICVFDTSLEGTPLFREKEHFFWVPKPTFNLHSAGGHLSTQKVTDHKEG